MPVGQVEGQQPGSGSDRIPFRTYGGIASSRVRSIGPVAPATTHQTAPPRLTRPTAHRGQHGDRLQPAEAAPAHLGEQPVDADAAADDQRAERDQQVGADPRPDLGADRRYRDDQPGQHDRHGQADQGGDPGGDHGPTIRSPGQADQGHQPDHAEDHRAQPERRQPRTQAAAEQQRPDRRGARGAAERRVRTDEQPARLGDDRSATTAAARAAAGRGRCRSGRSCAAYAGA